MSDAVVYVGADIAKDSIDWDFKDKALSLPNSSAGFSKAFALLTQMGRTVHIVCEPTGGYERALLKAAASQGHSVCLVNAWRVRQHAKASGILAKTDRIDARLLSHYGRIHHPTVRIEPSIQQHQFADLVRRRAQVQDIRLAEINRLGMVEDRILRRSIQSLIRVLDRQLKSLDKRLGQLLGANPSWNSTIERLCQVKGVGRLTACSLLALMPELGTLNDQQAASLAGVAPFNVDSGKFKGRRRVQGGRPAIRKALYMAALVGIRYNPIFKACYQRLKQNGKPGKLALTAIMRKLIILLNNMLKYPDFALAR